MTTTVNVNVSAAGNSGEVQFNNAGAFGADSAFYWDNTNKRLGVGAAPDSTVRLDVRGQGALSTDIAFRVRDSANAANAFEVRGNNTTVVNGGTNQIALTINSGGSIPLRITRAASNTRQFEISGTLFYLNDSTSNRRDISFQNGNVVCGGLAALATTAVDGFLYIPTCAGTPTGVPTAYTGKIPMVIDSTNNKAYIYSGGTWVALN